VIATIYRGRRSAPRDRSIVAADAAMLEDGMVPDQTSKGIGPFVTRVVIDDHSRLPGRFFGRFATSATSELRRAV
jgi:hypothetical protein